MGQTVETWATATSANWTTPLDWSGGVVPTKSSYAAVFSAGSSAYTVTMSSGEQIAYLTQDDGTLLISSGSVPYLEAGAGNSWIAGTVQLTGGQIQALAGVSGHTLTVTGTGVVNSTSGTSYISGYTSGNRLTLDVASGGSISATGNSTPYLGYYSTDQVTNSGVISATGGTIDLGGPGEGWQNLGTLVAASGGVINLGDSFTTADIGVPPLLLLHQPNQE